MILCLIGHLESLVVFIHTGIMLLNLVILFLLMRILKTEKVALYITPWAIVCGFVAQFTLHFNDDHFSIATKSIIASALLLKNTLTLIFTSVLVSSSMMYQLLVLTPIFMFGNIAIVVMYLRGEDYAEDQSVQDEYRFILKICITNILVSHILATSFTYIHMKNSLKCFIKKQEKTKS